MHDNRGNKQLGPIIFVWFLSVGLDSCGGTGVPNRLNLYNTCLKKINSNGLVEWLIDLENES
jgi:hypothetical protein